MGIYCDRDGCDCGLPEDWEHRAPYLTGYDRINLGDGEMDFDPSNTLEDIYESLHERSKEIGGWVRWDGNDLLVDQSFTPDTHRIRTADGEGRDSEPVEIRVTLESTHQSEGGEVEHADIERLIDIGRTMKDALNDAAENGNLEFKVQKA